MFVSSLSLVWSSVYIDADLARRMNIPIAAT